MTTEKPETYRQAVHWETMKRRYLDAGLCIRCASQAAYGHQHGFSNVHPPCSACHGLPLPLKRNAGDSGLFAGRWLGSPGVALPLPAGTSGESETGTDPDVGG